MLLFSIFFFVSLIENFRLLLFYRIGCLVCNFLFLDGLIVQLLYLFIYYYFLTRNELFIVIYQTNIRIEGYKCKYLYFITLFFIFHKEKEMFLIKNIILFSVFIKIQGYECANFLDKNYHNQYSNVLNDFM